MDIGDETASNKKPFQIKTERLPFNVCQDQKFSRKWGPYWHNLGINEGRRLAGEHLVRGDA